MTDRWIEVLIPIVLAVCTGLTTEALSQLLVKSGRVSQSTKSAWRMLAAALAVTVGVAVYLLQPKLQTVPSLGRLWADAAAQELRSLGFQSIVRSERSAIIDDGLVVPESQRPIAGQLARPGTTVTYAVSTGSASLSESPVSNAAANSGGLAWTTPNAGEPLTVILDAAGVGKARVAGRVPTGLTKSDQLLLWVRPVLPPAETPGGYLQRPPGNGVSAASAGGSWEGTIQIGNRDFPPREGDIVDLAISVIAVAEARTLESRPGTMTTPTPRGSLVAQLPAVRLSVR